MQRKIKSYVLRAGRMTQKQQEGLDTILAQYITPEPTQLWSLASLFNRNGKTIVEIGFGMGHSLLTMAQNNQASNFIGIEVHRAGIGSLAAHLAEQAITNVRISPYDAVEVFENALANEVLDGVQIFFPDPWHKKRHHKRRLIQDAFIQLVVSKIKPGGFLHCATDWEDYAEQILTVLSNNPDLKNMQSDGGFAPRPTTRPITKFEQRGQRLGHGVWDVFFTKR